MRRCIVDNSDLADQAFDVLQRSERVLVGAGAGLSAGAGLAYGDPAFFEPRFPGYRDKYGIQGAYEGAFYPFATEGELWAYWARHIGGIRYGTPVGQAYFDLKALLRDKDCFVLTTNVDGQFEKAGFPRERLCTPQGDYAYFQCVRPCSPEIFPNRDWTERALAQLSDGVFSLPSEFVPRCPRCGGPVFPNLRKDSTFVEEPWLKGWELLQAWREAAPGVSIVLLEIGVGFNTPGIIRFPFESLARGGTGPLIRMNPDVRQRGSALLPPAFFGLAGDVAPLLAQWAGRP
jgi:NAD-dependent SIR2 family protein deacetylase